MGTQDKSALQLKLKELEQIRAKTMEQIPLAHGDLQDELRRMLEGLNTEITAVRERIANL